ncbi:hypothetical protein BST97_15595 [Nonlabens spongiae]|uniref:Glycosyltransferase subfamily 4-like N-terminal domain-containing protein n=1 Tax=Nonlabens spongiae TaxID=331648 RepID=A0A1W6MNW8_9FLAO|nr:hypothetical protein [Nonlabens spongiae]ARN76519.1 hypothetical protein BST97_00040 [Nonlabens spongiae]ARN79291.1 hypothetical protein BST97_15580 [Nonlabens spongiae]ARN79294.1 hypothetical protein BST97_15595 [Nonlabens spongiae]
MRILYVGHCNDLYIGYLNRIVKSNIREAITGVVDLNYSGPKEELYARKKNYDYSFSLKRKHKKSISSPSIKGLLQLPNRFLVSNILRARFKAIVKEIEKRQNQQVISASYSNIIREFRPTHIHVHYLDKNRLKWVDFAPEDCKIILSFWGSDLMTVPRGVGEYNVQYHALRKANVITTQTLDLRTILLSKYGQDLQPRIQTQTFDPLLNNREIISQLSTGESRKKFKLKYNIDPEKRCIQVGYSAAAGQNHIAILEQINQLPAVHKNTIAILIPLSYNNTNDYVSLLLKRIATYDFQIIPVLEFLPVEDMLQIVSGCDIFISMRQNDALNAAMLESLYAENLVITGAWLPYGIYRRNSIGFTAVDRYEDLKGELLKILSNFAKAKNVTIKNRQKLAKLFDSEQIASNWLNVYT